MYLFYTSKVFNWNGNYAIKTLLALNLENYSSTEITFRLVSWPTNVCILYGNCCKHVNNVFILSRSSFYIVYGLRCFRTNYITFQQFYFSHYNWFDIKRLYTSYKLLVDVQYTKRNTLTKWVYTLQNCSVNFCINCKLVIVQMALASGNCFWTHEWVVCFHYCSYYSIIHALPAQRVSQEAESIYKIGKHNIFVGRTP